MICPTCKREIRDHPAEGCLDALFAELVMGWKKSLHPMAPDITEWRKKPGRNIDYIIQAKDFRPSQNIAWAMEGVEKLLIKTELSISFDFIKHQPGNKYWSILIYYPSPKAPENYRYFIKTLNLELAITRALILWAGEKGE